MKTQLRVSIIIGLIVSCLLISGSVLAKYPEKSVTIIAPFPAGGDTDFVARTIAEAAKPSLPKGIVVINRPGGGATIGVAEALRAKAFFSGGVGQQERETLKEMGKSYSLKLIFSNRKGEYLTNVMVTVFNQKDEKILFTVSFGPWLFINLPSGVFNLEASFQGNRKKLFQVNIDKDKQKVVSFQW